jgi:hypothetical protein
MKQYPFLPTITQFYIPYYGLHHMSRIIPMVHYVFIKRHFRVVGNNLVRESFMK